MFEFFLLLCILHYLRCSYRSEKKLVPYERTLGYYGRFIPKFDNCETCTKNYRNIMFFYLFLAPNNEYYVLSASIISISMTITTSCNYESFSALISNSISNLRDIFKNKRMYCSIIIIYNLYAKEKK